MRFTGSFRALTPRLTSPLGLWLIGIALFGVAARVGFYLSPFGVPDADEAVGGLMARHALQGEWLSVFYWGQAYGGPLETWLAAPLLALTGPSWLALRLVPIVLTLAATAVVWRVALRIANPLAAATAAAVMLFFPSALIWKTVHFHIFYASALLLGALVLLQVLRQWERMSVIGMFLLGATAGVGIWQSFQLVTIVPVALGWLVYERRASLRRDLRRYWPACLGGFLLGVSPVLISNIRNDWWSRDIGVPGNVLPYWERVVQFFTNGLPMALDLRTAITLDWFLWKPLGLLVYAALLAGFVFLWVQTFSGRLRREARLPLAVLSVFPLLYAVSPLTSIPDFAGYLVVVTPVIAIVATCWVSRPGHVVAVTGAALVLFGTSVATLSLAYEERESFEQFRNIGDKEPLPRSFEPLITRLDELGLRRLYASYWIAFRLTFETDERIIAADMRPAALRGTPDGHVVPLPDDPYYKSRRPEYADMVARVDAPAFVLAPGFDVQTTDYASLVAAGYTREDVGAFRIYHKGALSRGH